ncbi:hypothetical protein LCGC14_0641730 [marine sediment metagenome]|uniref:DUF3326 domain-containing protein n=1 Tax=marine sediment metagenome TaxID=412755 RepID=A0A0F9QYY7_9ZZZZ|nr:DUF3326 domain-containing protein [Candidatus Aminicenantes bacterium]
MNVVLIIPTGIGCEIGGHAGDANPVAKLIGKCCNKLILHPNVVNASDINEMPDNALYIEGSILDRFLKREIGLKEVFYNKILLAVNKPAIPDTINAMNGARMTIGADIEIVELETELKMKGFYNKFNVAGGEVQGWEELCQQVSKYDFDALAIQTDVHVDKQTKLDYIRNGGVNPWGGVEAKASKLIADRIGRPVAHAPFIDWSKREDDLCDFYEVVDERLAAEMVSVSYLHCILKGLHKAPRIIDHQKASLIGGHSILWVDDIDFMITPVDCVGAPHEACMEAGIKIIAVRENKTVLNDTMPDNFIVVENYLEAAGLLMSFNSGINPQSVRRND